MAARVTRDQTALPSGVLPFELPPVESRETGSADGSLTPETALPVAVLPLHSDLELPSRYTPERNSMHRDSRPAQSYRDSRELREAAVRELRKATETLDSPHAATHLEAARLYTELARMEHGETPAPGRPETPAPSVPEPTASPAVRTAATPAHGVLSTPADRVREFYRVMVAAGVQPHQISATQAGRYAGCSRQGAAKTLKKLRSRQGRA